VETIQIALASDANYFPGLLVTAVSLARSAAREVALAFNVLDGGVGETNLSFLREKLEEAHPHVELKTFAVDESRFSAFPEWNSGSRMAYARLIIPELMSASDFVLYCDVDFLWTADVSEIWALRDPGKSLQACPDDWSSTLEKESVWYAAHGIDVDVSRYVCSGLLLINLKRFRAEDLSRRLMVFLCAHTDVLYADQSAINAVVPDIGILPRKWGRFARSLHGAELPGAWAIHFAGSAPWKDGWWTQAITDAHGLWYRTYAQLTGIGYLDAVRTFLTPRQYGTRRLTWIMATHALLRIPFLLLLRLVGRACYIPEIKEMAR